MELSEMNNNDLSEKLISIDPGFSFDNAELLLEISDRLCAESPIVKAMKQGQVHLLRNDGTMFIDTRRQAWNVYHAIHNDLLLCTDSEQEAVNALLGE